MSAVSPDPTLGELFAKLTSDVGVLVRDEVQLAKVELTESAQQTARVGALMAAAGVAGLLVIVMLSHTIAWALAEVMPVWSAFLIVTLLWAVAGGVAFTVGRQRLRATNLKPEQTIATVKEDVQWAKQQTH